MGSADRLVADDGMELMLYNGWRQHFLSFCGGAVLSVLFVFECVAAIGGAGDMNKEQQAYCVEMDVVTSVGRRTRGLIVVVSG